MNVFIVKVWSFNTPWIVEVKINFNVTKIVPTHHIINGSWWASSRTITCGRSKGTSKERRCIQCVITYYKIVQMVPNDVKIIQKSREICKHIPSLKRTQSLNESLSIGRFFEQSFQWYVEIQNRTLELNEIDFWSFMDSSL